MKKIRNIRRLVLLTALCAIISCGGAGGGDGTGSNNPTPTNPVNPTIKVGSGDLRYTKTKPSKITNDYINYLGGFMYMELSNANTIGQSGSICKYCTIHTQYEEAMNKNIINSGEYGYEVIVDRENFFPSSLNTMNANGITYSSDSVPGGQKILINGIGLNVKDKENAKENELLLPSSQEGQDYKNKLDFSINKIITQFEKRFPGLKQVEINPGATFIAFVGVWNEEPEKHDPHIKYVSLRNDSEYEFGRYDGTPYGVNLKIKITGDGSLFKYKDFVLKIDEDVDLDVSSNKYYKMLKRMINPKVRVDEGVKITGNNDNQIGIVAIERGGGDNNGTIELKGNNTIGAFIKNSTFKNTGTININTNSTGIYSINPGDDGLRAIFNDGTINVGENSTGVYMYSKYNNSQVYYSNDSLTNTSPRPEKISIKGGENARGAVGILFDIGEDKDPSLPDGTSMAII